MAITSTGLYILFILAFIIHDGEEIAVEHKWLLAHGETLREKHPKFRRMLNHLRQMNTKAFAIAVLEELIMLVVITVYVFWGGPYAVELWTAVFMAFSIRQDTMLLHHPEQLLTYRNDSLMLVLEGICIEDTVVTDVRYYGLQLFKKKQ